ncbi:MAG: hypothetical protein KBD83_04410 [Gammaproteobacteria bacterium]|nr:hypothetical protein [Gammaproteobacteria bacterium]
MQVQIHPVQGTPDKTFVEKWRSTEEQNENTESWRGLAETISTALGFLLYAVQLVEKLMLEKNHDDGISHERLLNSTNITFDIPHNSSLSNATNASSRSHAPSGLSVAINISIGVALLFILGIKSLGIYYRIENTKKTLRAYKEYKDQNNDSIMFIRYQLAIKTAINSIFTPNSIVIDRLNPRMIEHFTQTHFEGKDFTQIESALAEVLDSFKKNTTMLKYLWLALPMVIFLVAITLASQYNTNPKLTNVAIIGEIGAACVLAATTAMIYLLERSKYFPPAVRISTLQEGKNTVMKLEESAQKAFNAVPSSQFSQGFFGHTTLYYSQQVRDESKQDYEDCIKNTTDAFTVLKETLQRCARPTDYHGTIKRILDATPDFYSTLAALSQAVAELQKALKTKRDPNSTQIKTAIKDYNASFANLQLRKEEYNQIKTDVRNLHTLVHR